MSPGGGGIDMATAPTAQSMQNLGQVAASLGQAWATAKAAVGNAEGQLGMDELGQIFLQTYRAPVTAITQAVDRHVAGGERLATAGQQAIKQYQQSDQSFRQKLEVTGAPR